MKNIIFTCLFVIGFCFNLVFSQGHYAGAFTFFRENATGYDLNLTMSVKSPSFESMTNDLAHQQYVRNRLDSLQNGNFFRLYESQTWPPPANTVLDIPITYFNTNTTAETMLDLTCIAMGDLGLSGGGYGFALYEIKLDADDHINPVEHYDFYFNTLDSKFGKDWQGLLYNNDWFFIYDGSRTLGQRFFITANMANWEITIVNGTEYKVWNIIYNQSNPWATDFYVRTTPFPFSPDEIFLNGLRNFYLGTNVIIDDCLPNSGQITERQGYNTFLGSSYVNRNYYTNPPIPSGVNITGKTFCTPAMFYIDENSNLVYGTRITARAGEKLTLKHYKKLWVSGIWDDANQKYQGDTLIFSPGSSLELEDTAYIYTCFGGCFFDSAATLTTHNLSRFWAYPYSWIGFYGNTEHVINNGGEIVVEGNGTLIVGDNTTLTFDGANSFLWLNSNASVKLGENARINFKNGASIEASYINFTSLDPAKKWQEIYFENPKNIWLQYCAFSNGNNELNINGQNIIDNGTDFKIFNCTFNVPSGGTGIYFENIKKFLCQYNTFNIFSDGIGVMLQNTNNTQLDNPAILYSVNFLNNTFNNGYIQMYLGSYATEYTPCYIYNNQFSNNSGGWCFCGRMITDVIKNNTFNTSSNYSTIGLWQSDIKLNQNIINNSNNCSIQLNNAFPMIAPIKDGNGNLIWYGGKNTISSINGDNVSLFSSYAIIDFGENNFTINNSSAYHIYGSVPDSVVTYYYGRNNCWYNNGVPRTFLYNSNIQNIPILYSGNTSCPLSQEPYIGNIIVAKGDSTYDTISISSDNSGVQPNTDETIFDQASQYSNQALYLDAIINFKYLIDNYPQSNYLIPSLSQMFTCYEQLDTSQNQNYKYTLYNDCETYLNSKIEEYQNITDFVNTAYNYVLICNAQMGNLNTAASGYELIALYNPDPEIRLYASWDYGFIQDLINGPGGFVSNEKNLEKSSKLRIKKLLDKNHSARIVKANYDKLSNKLKNDNNLKNLKIDNSRAELIKNTAKSNIYNSKSLTHKEKQKKHREQLELLFGKPILSQNQAKPIIPNRYDLFQNYPNPFNPATKIKYNLPKTTQVCIKIYDILGREVITLINEIKQAGSYEIEFNGGNLASGVYFYRIQTNDFVAVKKMVLIK